MEINAEKARQEFREHIQNSKHTLTDLKISSSESNLGIEPLMKWPYRSRYRFIQDLCSTHPLKVADTVFRTWGDHLLHQSQHCSRLRFRDDTGYSRCDNFPGVHAKTINTEGRRSPGVEQLSETT